MNVEKVFITCSIHHHIVCDVCSPVNGASATACGCVHKDCLCSIWNDTGDVVGSISCCVKVTVSYLYLVNWCPRN